jgi:cysteinyl-tRNA synthetase
MSKSLGNLYTLDDIEKRGFSPLAYRYLCLGTHYRQTLNFTWEALEGAQAALTRVVRTITSTKDAGWDDREGLLKFNSVIYDDLNTPQALAVLWNHTHNKALAYKFDEVLGLGLKEAVEKFERGQVDIPEGVKRLLQERETARLGKDWGRADKLRAQIKDLGYEIADGADGPSLVAL